MNRDELAAEVRDIICSPQSEDKCVEDLLAAADSYGAYLIEKHARSPVRQRRREWGEREREGAS